MSILEIKLQAYLYQWWRQWMIIIIIIIILCSQDLVWVHRGFNAHNSEELDLKQGDTMAEEMLARDLWARKIHMEISCPLTKIHHIFSKFKTRTKLQYMLIRDEKLYLRHPNARTYELTINAAFPADFGLSCVWISSSATLCLGPQGMV